MNPTYPEFSKITIDAKLYFDNFCKLTTASDFNLMSLLSWNAEGNNSYSILNDNLVIRIKDYLTDGVLYSILGQNMVFESVFQLVNDHSVLNLVPEAVLDNMSDSQKAKFDISEDRDSFDYVLSTNNIVDLEGSDLKALRKHVNGFKNSYDGYSLRTLDILNAGDKDLVKKLTTTWCNQKGFEEEKLAEELQTVENFAKYAAYFDCVLLGLFIENELIAFTFNEIVNKDFVMGHFGKANNQFSNVSYFIEYLTAEYFFNHGIKFLNHEQDTGLLGLRAAKMTYAPIYFLKKYTISLS